MSRHVSNQITLSGAKPKQIFNKSFKKIWLKSLSIQTGKIMSAHINKKIKYLNEILF